MLDLQKFQGRDQSPTPTQICWPQKSRTEKGVAILEMKHHRSCSGMIKNRDDIFQKRLLADKLWVQSIQLRIKNATSESIQDSLEAQIPLTSGIKLQILNYVVAIKLGGRKLTVIVDTGSDLTWVQCNPCQSCYSQQEPLFNPSISPLYKSILCNSSTCGSLESATGYAGLCGKDKPSCEYSVSYSDGSYTSGELGSDQLNFGSSMVENFVFGCGQSNSGIFGGAAGLMGLGRSQLSLVTQTSTQFGGVFSYCLPSTEDGASGSLILGGDPSVYKNSTPISFTRMVWNPQLPTFYLLNLTSISIGGVALQSLSFSNTGSLIDSGTVITRLVPSAYRALRNEFLKQFDGYPSAPGFSILDTCFNLSSYKEVNVPTLKFHFEGKVEMNVDVSGIFYFVKSDASQVCLALASLSSEYEIGIIGNYQQKNLRVVYDSKASRLGFGEETCNYI